MAGAPDSIRVVGLSTLRRDLKKVDAELPKELALINRQAAEIVAEEAQRRAPKGIHQGSGRAFRPIWRSIEARQQAGRAAISIGGARAPHAAVTEFGGHIPRRGRDKTLSALAQQRRSSYRRVGFTSLTRVRAQPYLYPALAAKRDEVIRRYEDLIEQLLTKVSSR